MTTSHNPKVSVIIPTHNRAALLPRAVKSALSQTLEDIEVIIIDDASTDDTRQIIAAFHDPRVRCIRHEMNQHLATTRNTGIANARGEYVALLDDDDELLPNALEELSALLDASPPDAGLAYGLTILVDEGAGTRSQPYGAVMNGDLYEYVLSLKAPPGPSGWLFRTSALREVGGFTDGLRRVEDIDLLVRFGMKGFGVRCLPKATFIRHQFNDADRLTNLSADNLARLWAFSESHLKTYAAALKSRPGARVNVLHELAWISLIHGNKTRAAWALVRAAATHPVPRNILLCAKLFVWHVSPLRRFRDRARALRNRLRGRK